MYGNRSLINTSIAAFLGSILLFSTSASASSNSAETEISRETAEALVEEYRELRRSCAHVTGEERKACFHQLHVNIGEYRVAKRQLEANNDVDQENIHLVVF